MKRTSAPFSNTQGEGRVVQLQQNLSDLILHQINLKKLQFYFNELA